MFYKVMFSDNCVFYSLTELDETKLLRLRLPDVTIGLKNDVDATSDCAIM
jgi:hypothetical protein